MKLRCIIDVIPGHHDAVCESVSCDMKVKCRCHQVQQVVINAHVHSDTLVISDQVYGASGVMVNLQKCVFTVKRMSTLVFTLLALT